MRDEDDGPEGGAPDAPMPPASAVVDLAAKRAAKASASTSAGPPSQGESGGADAPKKGKGGRREKKRDYGLFNKMLQRFTLIYPTDMAWDHDLRCQVKISNMAHMFGTDYVRMWKASPDRRTVYVEKLVFDPTMQCAEDSINLYDGFAIEPQACEAGEVGVMLRLLEHLCGRCKQSLDYAGAAEVMQWVLRWLAMLLQRPGAKMRSALVFHGPQGTGKNLFFDAIRGIFGKYGVMVGQTELDEKYNGWISAKILILANEVVSRQELYHNKNRLKWIITEETIPIRLMNTDTRWERNHANLIFVSNESQPLALERGDRRHLVVYTPTPEEKGLYAEVRDFLANGGAAKFMHYLLNYPLGDFDEHTKPPMTEAKEELIGLGMRPAERFMREWVGGFIELPQQVCSSEQLYRAFQRWCADAGERWSPSRDVFTSEAKRWTIEQIEKDDHGRVMDPVLEYKVVSPPAEPGDVRKSMRVWIPRGTGPPAGITEGAWAKEAVGAFELPLGRFCRGRGPLDEPPPPRAGKKGNGNDD